MSLSDALSLRNAEITLPNGMAVTLRRPSALDFIEGAEIAAKTPSRLYAWFVHRHLLAGDGKPVFDNIDAALAADGRMVMLIAKEAEKLYEEGRD